MKILKGKAFVSLASLAILGGITVGSVGVFATDQIETPVRVQFEEPGEIIVPPGREELSLVAVPDLTDFDSHEAGNAVQHTAVTTPSTRYVGLHDDRPGSELDNGQWTLTAKASELENTANSSVTIDSGNINVSVGTWNDWTMGTSVTTATTPTLSNIQAGTGLNGSILPLTLDDTSYEVAKTDNSSRQGYALPIQSMELSLTTTDADWAGQTFEGNITWTLTNTI